MPIRSFADEDTGRLFEDVSVRRFATMERQARRKLGYLDAAVRLDDLRVPPGNRLGTYFGTSPEVWLNLQSRFDLRSTLARER